jgi:hypothetical protein
MCMQCLKRYASVLFCFGLFDSVESGWTIDAIPNDSTRPNQQAYAFILLSCQFLYVFYLGSLLTLSHGQEEEVEGRPL